jgi:hypothetical protein
MGAWVPGEVTSSELAKDEISSNQPLTNRGI